MDNNIVIVTGMHRSGTSLFSNYLSKIGLNIGKQIIPPDRGNPLGYYEDFEMVDFHNHILEKNRLGYFFKHRPKIKTDRQDFEIAREMILSKSRAGSIWGWKDPRTCLFLDFWNKVIDDKICFIFVFRDPYLSANSLIRRNTDPLIQKQKYLAFKNYCIYNKRIINFIKSACPNYLLINIESFVKDYKKYDKAIKSFLEISDNCNIPLHDIFYPRQLQSHTEKKTSKKSLNPMEYLYVKRAEKIFAELKNLELK